MENFKFYLDTNALYAMLRIFGIKDKIFTKDKQIRDLKFRKFIKRKLKMQSLYIPPATMFEFVDKFKDNEKQLEKICVLLKKLSLKYNYNLFLFSKDGELFSFDQFSESESIQISADYIRLVKIKEFMRIGKIGSEAHFMVFLAEQILILYLIDCLSEDPNMQQNLEMFYAYVFNSFYLHKGLYNDVAHKLNNYYIENTQGKNKKEIFEYTLKLCYSILPIFIFLLDKSKIIKDKNGSLQRKLFRWYCNKKDLNKLNSIIDLLLHNISTLGYNPTQLVYLKNALTDLMTKNIRREKNDSEDFDNLRYSNNNDFLITFEKELILTIKTSNVENYKIIKSFTKKLDK